MFLHAHSADGLQAEDVLQIAQLADPSKEIVAALSTKLDHICTNLFVETSHKRGHAAITPPSSQEKHTSL
jgi:hypothetical protein